MQQHELLEEELRGLKLQVSDSVRARLQIYLEELEHWRHTVNLTSLQGRALVRRLVVEPIWIANQLQMSGKLLDVGSGNGSPAIPILLTSNFVQAHLVEPRARRAAFLRHVAARLELKTVSVHKKRLEEADIPSPDWVTMQALRPTPLLLAALRRIAAPSTRCVWVTAEKTSPIPGEQHLVVPGSRSEAWVWRLDQS